MDTREKRWTISLAISPADGTIVERVVDLTFFESGSGRNAHDLWTVVDFKSDVELELGLEVYRRQVSLYAEMASRATGHRTAPVLIRV